MQVVCHQAIAIKQVLALRRNYLFFSLPMHSIDTVSVLTEHLHHPSKIPLVKKYILTIDSTENYVVYARSAYFSLCPGH
jgi:hypothetical protein